MIKVENIDVWGFEHAIRGCRNPKNSWDKSDSGYNCVQNEKKLCDPHCTVDNYCDTRMSKFIIGDNDLDLMKRLYKAGVEHRTYARLIQVSMDITAPLYFWKEADRYSVGKSQISTSTMHKIHEKKFDINDFSHDYLEKLDGDDYKYAWQDWMDTINCLNYFRELYNKTKEKKYWRMMIEKLPSSYNQRRTILMSYEVVFKIIKERTGHKLDEWNQLIDELKKLPYIKEITEE